MTILANEGHRFRGRQRVKVGTPPPTSGRRPGNRTPDGFLGHDLAAFARLDVQGKGYLLRADLVQRQVEFLVSEDPDAPGNHYFGVIDTAALSPAPSGG